MANTPLQNAPRNKIVTQDKKTGVIGSDIPVVWRTWFDFLVSYINTINPVVIGSGITANRPTTNLYVGYPWFDTTVGCQINVKSLGPPVVWVNGIGTVV
jgi:hypothetical protein